RIRARASAAAAAARTRAGGRRPGPAARARAPEPRPSRAQVALLGEMGDETCDALLDGLAARVDHHLVLERRLVGRRDAGELGNLAGAGLLVETLHVARFAGLDARGDVHFDEAAGFVKRAHQIA